MPFPYLFVYCKSDYPATESLSHKVFRFLSVAVTQWFEEREIPFFLRFVFARLALAPLSARGLLPGRGDEGVGVIGGVGEVGQAPGLCDGFQ